MAGRLQDNLTAERGLIFRITHRANLPWILKHGLHCSNAAETDPSYVGIGNPDLIEKRTRRPVPIEPHGTLADYVPFYFTPFTPMLLNIKTGWGGVRVVSMDEVLIIVSSIPRLRELGTEFVFTDRHAYLATASFYREEHDLRHVDFALLRQRDFTRDPEDPERFEKYQAEALVYRAMTCEAILGIVCNGPASEGEVRGMIGGDTPQLLVKPGWFV